MSTDPFSDDEKQAARAVYAALNALKEAAQRARDLGLVVEFDLQTRNVGVAVTRTFNLRTDGGTWTRGPGGVAEGVPREPGS